MRNLYLFNVNNQIGAHITPENHSDAFIQIPYSVGCIWAYASQFEDIKTNYNLKDIIFVGTNKLDELVNSLENPDICAFSNPVWNEAWNLAVAKKIKRRWPNCLIVFGGPNVLPKLVNDNSFIDVVVQGEGEHVFLEILRARISNKPIDKYIKSARITDLATLPSPYTMGLFDKILSTYPNAYWMVPLETVRGCPYQCTFCDWGGLTNTKIKKFGLSRFEAEMQWLIGKPKSLVMIIDANFGILKERDLEAARIFVKYADHKDSNVQTAFLNFAKNTNETVFQIASIIKKYIPRGITTSVQSMHDKTLEAVKRDNFKINIMTDVIRLSRKYDIPTYTEVILGLPEETIESWKTGLCSLLEHQQHTQLSFYNFELIPTSESGSDEYIKKYGLTVSKLTPFVIYEDGSESEQEAGFDKRVSLVVTSTNTMSRDEYIECTAYTIMLQEFHYTKMTYFYAKYARDLHGVSYRTFYDALFNRLFTPESPFFLKYTKIKTDFDLYYSAKLDEGVAKTTPFNTFMEMFEEHFHEGLVVLESLVPEYDRSIAILQENYYNNKQLDEEIKFFLEFDYRDFIWKKRNTEYTIISSNHRLPEQFFPNVGKLQNGASMLMEQLPEYINIINADS